jgi:hypothetical protein
LNISTGSFNSFYNCPPAAKHDDGWTLPEAIQGSTGLVVDKFHESAESLHDDLESLLRDLEPASNQFSADADAFGSPFDQAAAEDVKGAVEDLQSATEGIGKTASVLGKIGSGLSLLDAGGSAFKTFENSDLPTTAGKLADATLAGASKLLTTVDLPVAVADFATHGAISDFIHGSGRAVAAGLAAIATGNRQPCVDFRQSAEHGDLGVVVKGIADTVGYFDSGRFSSDMQSLVDY